jgi:hypothetical protein
MKDHDVCSNGKFAHQNYKITMNRLEIIRAMGYNVVQKWACDVKDEQRTFPAMKDFFDDMQTKVRIQNLKFGKYNFQGSINPRDAFYGGITQAFKMMESVEDDLWMISVFDIISLYPYINFTGPYPLQHPEIIYPESNEADWDTGVIEGNDGIIYNDRVLRGLIKVKVVPPKGLYIPILPIRIPDDKHKRLLLTLCPKCPKKFEGDQVTKVFDRYDCPHTDEERSFTTTTTTVELVEALRRGYKVKAFYRAWHYENWTTDETNSFRDYVRQFIKMKVENSALPEELKTEADIEAWIEKYRKHGIIIDITKVKLNKGI